MPLCNPTKRSSRVQPSAGGPDPSRDSGHAAPSLARRSPRDSRNIAIALALVTLAVLMFFVTMVKFEEQLYGNGLFQAEPPWGFGRVAIGSCWSSKSGLNGRFTCDGT